jgi:Coenzyme PQQ synthesis protein D (PqqD)
MKFGTGETIANHIERGDSSSLEGCGRARGCGRNFDLSGARQGDRVGDLASIYSLNSTASLIRKLLGSPRTLTQLAMAFAQEYEVEPEMVRGTLPIF